jgi:hypothetical protein
VDRCVKAKKSCCKDDPRCKRCPVVLKKLAREGLAEQLAKRTFALAPELTKKQLAAARARGRTPAGG